MIATICLFFICHLIFSNVYCLKISVWEELKLYSLKINCKCLRTTLKFCINFCQSELYIISKSSILFCFIHSCLRVLFGCFTHNFLRVKIWILLASSIQKKVWFTLNLRKNSVTQMKNKTHTRCTVSIVECSRFVVP